MSYETKVALEKIADICSTTTMINDRLARVYDIALEGLGRTYGQHKVEIQSAIQRKRDFLAMRREERNQGSGS